MLLGAFTHGTAYAYDCDVHGSCPATYTDTDVPLLHLPLVVLTDRNCASAANPHHQAGRRGGEAVRPGTCQGGRPTARTSASPVTPRLWDFTTLQGKRLAPLLLARIPESVVFGQHPFSSARPNRRRRCGREVAKRPGARHLASPAAGNHPGRPVGRGGDVTGGGR